MYFLTLFWYRGLGIDVGKERVGRLIGGFYELVMVFFRVYIIFIRVLCLEFSIWFN